MAKSKERRCLVCGCTYYFCPRCEADSTKPRWMFVFHNENCKNLDHIASDYLAGEIDKETAKSEFDKCDLSNKDNLHKSIVKAIDEVYGAKTKSTVTEKEENKASKFIKKSLNSDL